MRVLLVEDEPTLAYSLRRGLREACYAVDAADDGDAVLDYIAAARYDLIILDTTLPKRDGLSVCRDLRRQNVTTPILMLNARNAVADRVAGLDSGADDYLVKPFAFQELLARMRALLRRPPEMRGSAGLQVADLQLDTVNHIAQRGDRAISLSATEYALLECLMRHPNQTLTRTQIREHVWDLDFVGKSNVIDVYVGYLRRKIDDSAAIKLIHTIRGVGYRVGVING
jgi:DNA-binding response OmpR family regulator